MTNKLINLSGTMLLATCLTLGCGGDADSAATVDSDLPGVYQITRYETAGEDETTGEGCEPLAEPDQSPSHLALYGLPSNDDPNDVRLVGQFCSDVDECREIVRNIPARTNYSFFEGNDAAGWQGWGIAVRGSRNDQCLFEVQTHVLTSTSARAITIDTEQVETEFPPVPPAPGDPVTNEIECSVSAAIDAITDDSPCKKLFLLEATFEASL
jgi:hypothetical protein